MDEEEAFERIAKLPLWWPEMIMRGLHPENKTHCWAMVEWNVRSKRLDGIEGTLEYLATKNSPPNIISEGR